jgi:hypothetical protein
MRSDFPYEKSGLSGFIIVLLCCLTTACKNGDLRSRAPTTKFAPHALFSRSRAAPDAGAPEPIIDPMLKTVTVASTDPSIRFKPDENHLYRECDSSLCADDQTLFVFLPGTDGSPGNYMRIAGVIGKTGIRVLVLAYQNNGSAQSICTGSNADACFTNFRRDRVSGSAASDYVNTASDGIENRVLKALQKLGWSQFYSGSTILWGKIIIGGFSQGAGLAAWIGKHHSVARVCQISGPWDHTKSPAGPESASWLSETTVTNAALFYGFTHQNDLMVNGVNYLDGNWSRLGMPGTPEFYSSSMTGQKLYSNDSTTGCRANPHGCSVMDAVTPLSPDGSPKFAAVWRYVCGR